MTTVNPSEPIAELLARSSLGTARIRVLAASAPAPVVREILRQLPKSPKNPAPTSAVTRIYSSSQQQHRPGGSREE